MGVALLSVSLAGNAQRLLGREGGGHGLGHGDIGQLCSPLCQNRRGCGGQLGQAGLGPGDLRLDQLAVGLVEVLSADIPQDIQQPKHDVLEGRVLLRPADPGRPGRNDRGFQAEVLSQLCNAAGLDIFKNRLGRLRPDCAVIAAGSELA
jgi:hypothetical protein